MTLSFRRPSPALVIATLALVMAMSGTAVAVTARSGSGATANSVSSLAWSGIILQSGWSGATRAPQATIDADGFVHLRGAVFNKSGTGTTTIGQLPAATRPTVNIAMTAHTASGGPVGIILQRSTGLIILQRTVAPNLYVGLEGVSFSK